MNVAINKIMLVTNEVADARGAEATARAMAVKHSAGVCIVDTIRTPFHAPRIPSLSTELMFEAALKSKKAFLENLKDEFGSDGVQVSTDVLLSPRSSAEIVSRAVDEGCDLVIRYMKGQSSRAAGKFGQTAENLMRACPIPVLLVEQPVENPKVVACINLDHGPEENQAILKSAEMLASSNEDLMVLSCWEFTGKDFMMDYIDEAMYEQTRDESAEIYKQLFEKMCSEYTVDDFADHVHLIHGDPVNAIPKFCQDYDIDVAVMCSASLNHPLGRKMGSTIERTIKDLPCSLMVVKPIGFESMFPVQIESQSEMMS